MPVLQDIINVKIKQKHMFRSLSRFSIKLMIWLNTDRSNEQNPTGQNPTLPHTTKTHWIKPHSQPDKTPLHS